MKKKNFVTLILATTGGLLFGIGLCMCLLPQWGMLAPGIVVASIGAAVLLAMLLVRRKMAGKGPARFNTRAAGTVLLGILGGLVLGTGMCMTMVWQGLMLPGIAVGCVGILLLVALVPVYKGIKE